MSETKNAPPRVGRWYRVGGTAMEYLCDDWMSDDETRAHVFLADDGADVKIAVSEWPSADAVSLGTTGQRFAALEARIAALEARLLAPPAVAGTTASAFTAGLKTWEETIRGAARVIADEMQGRPIACHVDHDACSAEQRSSTGRAAQGPCVRGVVDLVAASADDQHAAERGTPAAGAEVTASEGGDTAQADSVVAELREVADMLAKADRLEREAEHVDPLDGAWRADLGYAAKTLRRDALLRITSWRERAVVGERRKWAVAIASALDGADRSGCESFVSCEEMAASVAAMRAELERERKLRRESEEVFKAESMRRDLAGANLGRELALKREQEVTAERDAQRHELAEMRAELERERVRRRAAEDALSKAARDPRSEEARKRGLTIGARVRAGLVRGVVVGWSDGNPLISWANPTLGERQAVWCARDVELDTEATT